MISEHNLCSGLTYHISDLPVSYFLKHFNGRLQLVLYGNLPKQVILLMDLIRPSGL